MYIGLFYGGGLLGLSSKAVAVSLDALSCQLGTDAAAGLGVAIEEVVGIDGASTSAVTLACPAYSLTSTTLGLWVSADHGEPTETKTPEVFHLAHGYLPSLASRVASSESTALPMDRRKSKRLRKL